MCWEGFCWNFNLTGPQKKSSHETQISFGSSLELFIARSVTAVSSGACSEGLYGGDCVWNKHTFTQGVSRLLIRHLLCALEWPQVSPEHPDPQKRAAGSVFRLCAWAGGHFTDSMDGVGRAVLPPVLGSVELQPLQAAGVPRRVICSQLKLLRVHDRANYLGNEAENAGRLEYYIVKSFRVNSVCDQISCCFKYHITCSTLVWANEYGWMCHWICMPPNLINILTNSTSRDVWHKLHPPRSRLAQFVCVCHVPCTALLNWLHSRTHPERLGTGEPHAGKGLLGRAAAGREGTAPAAVPRAPGLPAAALPAGCAPGAWAGPSSAGSPAQPCVWGGCAVPTEALRSGDWSGRAGSCAWVCPCWVQECIPGISARGCLGSCGQSCSEVLLLGGARQLGPHGAWENGAPSAQVFLSRKC